MAVLTLTHLVTDAKEHMIQNQHLVTFRLKSVHVSFQKAERHFSDKSFCYEPSVFRGTDYKFEGG